MKTMRATLVVMFILPLAAESLLWIDVPYVRQPPEGCGAAALSMVIRYWQQRDTSIEKGIHEVSRIQRQLYVPELKGIPAAALAGYLKGHGFRVFDISGEWKDLEKHISLGRPLIACLGAGEGAPLHYVVVVGVDSGKALIHDPAAGKLLPVKRSEFDARWQQCHRWMLLALPPAKQAAMPRGVSRAAPGDEYQNEYLATLYFVEGNLEAALKYWNRVGKPRLGAVSFDPPLPLDPLAEARLLPVSIGDMLTPRGLEHSRRMLDGLGFLGKEQLELVAKPESLYELQVRTAERPSFPKASSILRGAPFLALHLDFYNLRETGINWTTMLRFDAQKRRLLTSFDVPFTNTPHWRYGFTADVRREIWNTGGEDFRLNRTEAGGELRRIYSWVDWRNAVLVSKRSLPDLSAPALKYRTQAAGTLALWPEHTLSAEWGSRVEIARLFSSAGARYARLNGFTGLDWRPGRKNHFTAVLRSGTSLGTPPFDELYMLGLERDNDLLLRAHIGTRDGKKGASPLARGYVLAGTGYDRTLYRHGLFTIAAGPFVDIAKAFRTFRPDDAARWLYDSGGQVKLQLLGAWEARLTYGRALREGTNAIYLTVAN